MTRLIDADALIEDLEYDVELDARELDDTDLLLGINREIVQFDKDCKQNAVDMLKKAPTVDAIQIDWIKEYIRTHPASTDIYFKWMIDEWKEEQEKENGRK